MKFNYKSRKGFTLIELLVVIGILAVLAAIAIPSVAGLIDRANVSADNTNANEMTNALERFASEYELYVQDIGSGALDPSDLDSAQGRVYNVTGATTRGDITAIEKAQSVKVADVGDDIAIYRDTKYPVNNATLQKIVENYMKTSSSTFEPKQSDCNYYYSPDCGIVVCTETDKSSTVDLNALVVSGKDAKGKELGPDTQWINISTTTETNNLDTWETKNWEGFSDFYGDYIWTDGINYYLSDGTNQYVLVNGKWETKTWNGLTNFLGGYVWTDGNDIYYSYGTKQYVLNGNTWEAKVWNGLTKFDESYIWTDGNNIYYSYYSTHYVLNGNTWAPKTWNGLTNFVGYYVWSDGSNTYYSENSKQYKLNGNNWTLNNNSSFSGIVGTYVWTDEKNTYYSRNEEQYVMKNGEFIQKDWNNFIPPTTNIWSDGQHIYYSHPDEHYVLK